MKASGCLYKKGINTICCFGYYLKPIFPNQNVPGGFSIII